MIPKSKLTLNLCDKIATKTSRKMLNKIFSTPSALRLNLWNFEKKNEKSLLKKNNPLFQLIFRFSRPIQIK